jgi:hypothetical protein
MNRLSFDQTFAAVATGAVVAGLIAGFWVLGTPGRQRQISADRQRIEDLQAVADILHQQYQQSLVQEEDYTLPDTLTASENRTDPVLNQPYPYQRLSDQTYQLCADFATDSSTYAFVNRPPSANAERWQHPEGTHCFEFDVTERLFFWD